MVNAAHTGHDATPLRADPNAAGAFWDRIAVPGTVHEARALTKGRRGPLRWFGKTASGYFNSRDAFSAATGQTSGQDAVGVYMTLNPVNPALLARGINRIIDNIDTSTNDQDVQALRRLLIDVDPERPSGISASNEEQVAAIARRDEIRTFLRDSLGWGEPLAVTSSGNGGGLIYDIDLPNDAPSVELVQQALAALDRMFSDAAVKVDTANFNPARITRVAGTVTAKGDDFPGYGTAPARPWRRAAAIYPATPGTITEEQLRALVAVAPEPEVKASQSNAGKATGGSPAARTWTVEQMLTLNGLQAVAKQHTYGCVFQLDRCLTSTDHNDGACIIERTGGAIVYTCRHARCQGKDWRYLREHNIVAVPPSAVGDGTSAEADGTRRRTDGHDAFGGIGGASGHSESGDGWAKPMPLRPFAATPFPLDALASWQQAYVGALAESSQTPIDLAGTMVLAATSLAVAGKVEVQVKPDYREPLNLWLVCTLPPAERKTSIITAISQPFATWEGAEAARLGPIIAEAKTLQEINEDSLKAAKSVAARASGDDRLAKIADATHLAREAAATVIPTVPRLLVDDCTPEKLATLLAENRGRIGVLTDEAGVFGIMAGRYSAAPNLDVYLKSHAGSQIRVDRGNRAPDIVSRPALTMGLAIQPGVLSALSATPEFRGRGLLGRFLYALPTGRLGQRNVDAPALSDSLRDLYNGRLAELLALQPRSVEDADGQQAAAPWTIRLSPDAYAAWLDFCTWLEPQLAPDGELGSIGDWAGKLTGAVVRLAGVLHMAEHGAAVGTWPREIAQPTMRAAITLGRYFIPYARTAFLEMSSSSPTQITAYVLSWIERRGQATFSKRDVYQGMKGAHGINRVADLDTPLDILVEHDYIREQPTPPKAQGKGGMPPSPRYDVNPQFLPQFPHNSVTSKKGNAAFHTEPSDSSPNSPKWSNEEGDDADYI